MTGINIFFPGKTNFLRFFHKMETENLDGSFLWKGLFWFWKFVRSTAAKRTGSLREQETSFHWKACWNGKDSLRNWPSKTWYACVTLPSVEADFRNPGFRAGGGWFQIIGSSFLFPMFVSHSICYLFFQRKSYPWIYKIKIEFTSGRFSNLVNYDMKKSNHDIFKHPFLYYNV